MDGLNYNISMIDLLNGPDSNYEKKTVIAMNVAHRNSGVNRPERRGEGGGYRAFSEKILGLLSTSLTNNTYGN